MKLSEKSHRFVRANEGLAAVEFAFLLPVMITLFFGVVETSAALSCRASVTSVASTAADLVAQESVASAGDLTNVFNAANTILYPFYDPSSSDPNRLVKPTLTIASVVDNGATNQMSGRVAWVCSQGTPAVHVGDTVNFGQPLMTTGGSIIYAMVTYNYVSSTAETITGHFTMQNQFYSKPRRVAQIPAPTSCPT